MRKKGNTDRNQFDSNSLAFRLGEASTTAIVKNQNPKGFIENKKAAKQGGDVAGNLQETNSAFWFNKGAIISVWGPVILILGASLAFYQSFIRSTVITIKTPEFKRSISIRELDKKGDTDRLIPFLKSKDVLVFDKRD